MCVEKLRTCYQLLLVSETVQCTERGWGSSVARRVSGGRGRQARSHMRALDDAARFCDAESHTGSAGINHNAACAMSHPADTRHRAQGAAWLSFSAKGLGVSADCARGLSLSACR
jgi:hypothetical protein